MLTKEKLIQLMADLESETVERTRAFDKAEKMGQAISAFANTFLISFDASISISMQNRSKHYE